MVSFVSKRSFAVVLSAAAWMAPSVACGTPTAPPTVTHGVLNYVQPSSVVRIRSANGRCMRIAQQPNADGQLLMRWTTCGTSTSFRFYMDPCTVNCGASNAYFFRNYDTGQCIRAIWSGNGGVPGGFEAAGCNEGPTSFTAQLVPGVVGYNWYQIRAWYVPPQGLAGLHSSCISTAYIGPVKLDACPGNPLRIALVPQ
jgi:hypothetical protein